MGDHMLLKGHEILDPTVEKISMVARPASRVPFSFTKSDSSGGAAVMFDLKNIFAKSDAAPEAPAALAVQAIILNKSAVDAETLAILGGLGFETDKVVAANGQVIITQGTTGQLVKGETAIVRVSDMIAVAVPMFKSEGDFASMCAERGFYPAINIATELLQCELHKSVHKAKDPADAASMATKVTADFGQYIGGVLGSLPSAIFKLEKSEELATALRDTSKPQEPEAVEPKPGTPVEKGEAKGKAKKVKDENGVWWNIAANGDKSKIEKAEADILTAYVDGETPEPIVAETIAKDDATVAPVPAAPAFSMAELSAAISKAVKDEVAVLSTKLDAVAETANEAAELAKSANEELGLSVLGNVFDDKAGGRGEELAKSEVAPPLLDSGFSGRR